MGTRPGDSKQRENQSGYEAKPHLSDTHVELDTDGEEISLLLAGGQQQLVGVAH